MCGSNGGISSKKLTNEMPANDRQCLGCSLADCFSDEHEQDLLCFGTVKPKVRKFRRSKCRKMQKNEHGMANIYLESALPHSELFAERCGPISTQRGAKDTTKKRIHTGYTKQKITEPDDESPEFFLFFTGLVLLLVRFGVPSSFACIYQKADAVESEWDFLQDRQIDRLSPRTQT
jgi:hypothetical protein